MVDDQIRLIRGAFHTSDMVALAEALPTFHARYTWHSLLLRRDDELGLILRACNYLAVQRGF